MQRMPPELLAITPPMVHAFELAGSGPSRRAVSPKHRVDVPQDHSGTRAHPAAIVFHFRAVPMAADVDENIARLRLTIQAGSCGAKRRVPGAGLVIFF